jgi:hypothetical protein
MVFKFLSYLLPYSKYDSTVHEDVYDDLRFQMEKKRRESIHSSDDLVTNTW